jgi:hypothetical protein
LRRPVLLQKPKATIDRRILKYLIFTRSPLDFNSFHPFVVSQSKVQSRPKVALVPSAAPDFGDLLQVAGHHAHAGADRVPV